MLGGILCFDVAVSIPWRLIRRFEGRRSLENCSGRRSAVRGALLCGETPRPQPAPVSVFLSLSLSVVFLSLPLSLSLSSWQSYECAPSGATRRKRRRGVSCVPMLLWSLSPDSWRGSAPRQAAGGSPAAQLPAPPSAAIPGAASMATVFGAVCNKCHPPCSRRHVVNAELVR